LACFKTEYVSGVGGQSDRLLIQSSGAVASVNWKGSDKLAWLETGLCGLGTVELCVMLGPLSADHSGLKFIATPLMQ
jgi:hypothetical protein